MTEKFLKARVPSSLYEQLLASANEEGLRLGTYIRAVLERNTQAVTTDEALARVEAALRISSCPLSSTKGVVLSDEAIRALQEVRLLAREIALHQNAQIVARVAAQMKSSPTIES